MIEMMNVHAAKTNFSKLLARVSQGEEIVIAKGGVPVARLVPYDKPMAARTLGAFAGKIWMADDVLESPEWMLDAFEGVAGSQSPPVSSVSKRRKK